MDRKWLRMGRTWLMLVVVPMLVLALAAGPVLAMGQIAIEPPLRSGSDPEAIAAWIEERGIVDLDARHWAAEALVEAVEAGAIDLPADGRLQPDSPMSFYEVAASMMTWKEQPLQGLAPAEVAKQAVALKLIPGPAPEADRNLTRLEAAYIAAVLMGFEGTVKQEVELASLFTDSSLIPSDLQDEVYLVTVENRLLVGFPDRTFRPDDVFTRAQYATMIQRLWEIRSTPEVPALTGP